MNSNEYGSSSAAANGPSIGALIAQAKELTADQVERIVAHQRQHGLRFGEAAIALGLADGGDIQWALSQQFHYPYSPAGRSNQRAELVMANEPFGEQAEAFRSLRSIINMHVFAKGVERLRGLAVVSCKDGDGKSFFVANIAVAFSQLGGRTLVVDADMRKPSLHQIFEVGNDNGLSGILAGRVVNQAIQPVVDFPNLFVLPVGAVPPNPLELLERPAFRQLLAELREKFDYVIVDTPSSESGTDNLVIAERCGAALIVTRQDHSKVPEVQELADRLHAAEAAVVGAVLNQH